MIFLYWLFFIKIEYKIILNLNIKNYFFNMSKKVVSQQNICFLSEFTSMINISAKYGQSTSIWDQSVNRLHVGRDLRSYHMFCLHRPYATVCYASVTTTKDWNFINLCLISFIQLTFFMKFSKRRWFSQWSERSQFSEECLLK